MNIQPQTTSATSIVKRASTIEDERLMEVRFLAGLNLVIIKGWSIGPQEALKYQKILRFIDQHLECNQHLSFFFKYELFNCSSAAYILKILKRLNGYHHAGKKISVHWSSGETAEDMLEAGIDFKEFCDFKFKIALA